MSQSFIVINGMSLIDKIRKHSINFLINYIHKNIFHLN